VIRVIHAGLSAGLAWSRGMVMVTEAFRAALVEDFGSHHPLTDLMETGPVLGRCNYFLTHLPEWLSEERIDLGPEHGSSYGEILLLPKGVMGNIAPWNFAIESALVMCVDMLAAGNHVIIKPSELAPDSPCGSRCGCSALRV
jgi:coniferyl-aldehyde dehydrogenase